MPQIDFDAVPDAQDFSPLPPGDYPVELVSIEEDETQYGDEMWKLKFQVFHGEFVGRYVFDNIIFSEKALKRVKLICSRLGVKTSGSINLQPKHLLGKRCIVTVDIGEYEDSSGNAKKKNIVPYAGYILLDDDKTAVNSSGKKSQSKRNKVEEEDDLPF